MSAKAQPIDVTDSAELLDLVEEVRRSGVGRLLMRGEEELALLTPVDARRRTPTAAGKRAARLIAEHHRHRGVGRADRHCPRRAGVPGQGHTRPDAGDGRSSRPSRPCLRRYLGLLRRANRRDAGHESVAALMWTLGGSPSAGHHQLRPCRVARAAANPPRPAHRGESAVEVDASELTTVERVTARDERRAREIVFGYTDKDFSLTDATSFAVMERIRIGQAFTLDRNFVQFGWVVLDPTAHS